MFEKLEREPDSRHAGKIIGFIFNIDPSGVAAFFHGTDHTGVIECAFALIGKCFDGTPVRSLGVSVTDLEKNAVLQYDLVGEVLKSERTEKLETTVDELKKRFGSQCVRRAATLFDKRLGALQATDVPCNFDKRSLSE